MVVGEKEDGERGHWEEWREGRLRLGCIVGEKNKKKIKDVGPFTNHNISCYNVIQNKISVILWEKGLNVEATVQVGISSVYLATGFLNSISPSKCWRSF